MNKRRGLVFAAGAMLTAVTFVACGSTGPASATPTPTPTPLAQPVGYKVPTGCDLVGSGFKRNDNTTYWGLRCSEPGVLSIVLTPSLVSQGWEECGNAGGRRWFRAKDWVISVTAGPTTEQGELGEAPQVTGCGPMPE